MAAPDVPEMKPEVQALVRRGSVTREEITGLCCNSWEWDAVVRAADDDAFLRMLGHALGNSEIGHGRRSATTYDQAIGVLP